MSKTQQPNDFIPCPLCGEPVHISYACKCQKDKKQISYRDIINNYINGNKAEAVRQMKAYNIHAFTELLETDDNMLLYEKYKILKTYCVLSNV